MGHAHDRRRWRGRVSLILATIGLVARTLAISAPGAAGVANTCRARNLTKDTPVDTSLQRVITAASAGDTITVRYVCVGHFTIGKKLFLVGMATSGVPKPVLHGNGTGRTLLVGARVTLTNLKITGGEVSGSHWGGGIKITAGGLLKLNDSVVRANRAEVAGGIWNQGGLTMNGSSSVRDNTATLDASTGGIYADDNATLTMNGASSVSGNAGQGIVTHYATVVLNGTSSVSGNTLGILSQFSGLTMNDSSSVSDNTSLGISAALEGWVVMNDSSSVSSNGAGGLYAHNVTLTMNGSSSVSGNTVDGDGGGIWANFGSVHLYDTASVSGNTADADDTGGGKGGGIFIGCDGTLTGAVDGGNVNDNYRGTASPNEDNITYATPCV